MTFAEIVNRGRPRQNYGFNAGAALSRSLLGSQASGTRNGGFQFTVHPPERGSSLTAGGRGYQPDYGGFGKAPVADFPARRQEVRTKLNTTAFDALVASGLSEQTAWMLASEYENDPAKLATLESANTASDEAQAGRDSALGSLQQAIDRFSAGRSAFQTNPQHLAVRDALTQRIDPNYRAITAEQEAVARNQLAQNVARVSEAERVNAAGRGTLTSGTSQQGFASTRAQGEVGAARISSDIQGRNEQFRTQALQALGQLDQGDQQLDLAYQSALAEVDGLMARVQAGYTPQATDFLAFQALDVAQQQYDDEQRFLWASLEQMEKAAEWSWENDGLSSFLAIKDSGLIRQGLGLLGLG